MHDALIKALLYRDVYITDPVQKDELKTLFAETHAECGLSYAPTDNLRAKAGYNKALEIIPPK